MRKVFFGATFAFACLTGTAAWSGVLEEHSHSATSWGVGGWSGGYGVGGWKGNYSSKAATSEYGSPKAATTGATSVVTGTTRDVTFGLLRERRLLTELHRDSDCISLTKRTNGDRWRPGCK